MKRILLYGGLQIRTFFLEPDYLQAPRRVCSHTLRLG